MAREAPWLNGSDARSRAADPSGSSSRWSMFGPKESARGESLTDLPLCEQLRRGQVLIAMIHEPSVSTSCRVPSFASHSADSFRLPTQGLFCPLCSSGRICAFHDQQEVRHTWVANPPAFSDCRTGNYSAVSRLSLPPDVPPPPTPVRDENADFPVVVELELDGNAAAVKRALGCIDFEELICLVEGREDLADLDRAGWHSLWVDRFFAQLMREKRRRALKATDVDFDDVSTETGDSEAPYYPESVASDVTIRSADVTRSDVWQTQEQRTHRLWYGRRGGKPHSVQQRAGCSVQVAHLLRR